MLRSQISMPFYLCVFSFLFDDLFLNGSRNLVNVEELCHISIPPSFHPSILFIYVGFNVPFNTAYVISQSVAFWAEETSTYSWSRFCIVNCRPSGKQLAAFPQWVWGLNCRTQRLEASVLPLCRHGPSSSPLQHVEFNATLG